MKSKFEGQLPKPYSRSPHGTRVFPSHMNDANLEEPSRYVRACYVVLSLLKTAIVAVTVIKLFYVKFQSLIFSMLFSAVNVVCASK